MGYIWEEYKEDNFYYFPQGRQSYYLEVWRKNGKRIPINPYYRFTEVFFPLLLGDDGEKMKCIKDRYQRKPIFEEIFNLITHQLAILDRLNALSLEDIKMSLLIDEILSNQYGEEVKLMISGLQFDDLYIILKELVKWRETGEREILFDEVLQLLFQKVIIYKENTEGKILVYIEEIRNDYKEKLVNLVLFLFADMELMIEVFFANEHFGIIGNDSTMKVGKISCY